MRVGIVHPGAMGAQLAANITGDLAWASQGRSQATAERARTAGMKDVGSLPSLAEACGVIISVCPPGAAVTLASAIAETGYDGLYVDANAVAPSTARQISEGFNRFVDGGIVGGPPTSPGGSNPRRTRLYLSGDEAPKIVALFEGSNVSARILDGGAGKASAMKMAYAGWTKGSSALLLAMAAYANVEGVLDNLMDEWRESIPELPERLAALAGRVGAKSWRFVGEMGEIAQAQDLAGLPDGFHRAAEEIYRRLAELKGGPSGTTVDEVLALIEEGGGA